MNTKNTNRLQPFFKENRYYNHQYDQPESLLFHTIPSFIVSLHARKKRLPENKPVWFCPTTIAPSSNQPLITWIGHASFLIQIGGINIITDPIFGNASVFFPRIFPPGIPLHCLPPLDIIVLSHNHRDHCDVASLLGIQKLHPHVKVLVPLGDKKWLQKRGIMNVLEHTWWDTHTQTSDSGSVTCTFLPSHHWSGQGIFDRNKSLWGSWMITPTDGITSKPSIYFAGDTAYADHFKYIAQEFPHIGIALMPIAPGEPDCWMRKSHMDAQQAAQAFIDLRAEHFIPMHWGTFQFGRDTFQGPLERLQTAWTTHTINNNKLTIAKIGQGLLL